MTYNILQQCTKHLLFAFHLLTHIAASSLHQSLQGSQTSRQNRADQWASKSGTPTDMLQLQRLFSYWSKTLWHKMTFSQHSIMPFIPPRPPSLGCISPGTGGLVRSAGWTTVQLPHRMGLECVTPQMVQNCYVTTNQTIQSSCSDYCAVLTHSTLKKSALIPPAPAVSQKHLSIDRSSMNPSRNMHASL